MLLKRSNLFILLFLFVSLLSYAQNVCLVEVEFSLQGEEEPFPGICLYSSSKGNKVLKIISKGTNYLEVPSVDDCAFDFAFQGYDHIVCLSSDIIKIGETYHLPVLDFKRNEALDGAIVSADNSYITVENSIITYDVSKDPDAKDKTLQALFNKLPFVRVEADSGTLKLPDDSPIALTLNDRQSLLVNSGNISYMSKLLQGKHLKKISIDVDPKGKYSSAGALINIEAREDLPDLVAGEARIRIGDNHFRFSPYVHSTAKLGRQIYSLSYLGSSNKPADVYNRSERFSNGADYFSSDTTDLRTDLRHSIGISTSRDFSSKDVLFLTARGEIRQTGYDNYSHYITPDVENRLFSCYHSGIKTIGPAVSYQHICRGGVFLTFQYKFDLTKSESEWSGDRHLINATSSGTHQFSADLYKIAGKKLGWYAQSVFVSRHYDSYQQNVPLLDYDQRLARALGNIKYTLSPKVELSGELSYEYVWDNAVFNNGQSSIDRGEGNIDYSAKVSFYPKTGHSLNVSLINSVFRPSINWLNPYRDESVAGYVSAGNPSLENQQNYSLKGEYRFFRGTKISIIPSMEYNWSNNGLYNYTSVLEDGRMLRGFSDIGRVRQVFNNIQLQWRPSTKFRVNVVGWYNYHSYSSAESAHHYWEKRFMFQTDAVLWKKSNLFIHFVISNPGAGLFQNVQATRMHYNILETIRLTQAVSPKWSLTLEAVSPTRALIKEVRDISGIGFTQHSVKTEREREFSITVTHQFGRLKTRAKGNFRDVILKDNQKTN